MYVETKLKQLLKPTSKSSYFLIFKVKLVRGSDRAILVMRDELILFFVKREFRKLFFVTRDLKVLRDP